MNYIKSYKDLIVWRKAIKLVKEVFKLTGSFPKSELYGIVSQMRRAVVSIPANIAEGYGRKGKKEYQYFYSISYGSALELETLLIISKDLKFGDKKQRQNCRFLLVEILKMLNIMTKKHRGSF